MKIPWWNAAIALSAGIVVGFLLVGHPQSRVITVKYLKGEAGPKGAPVESNNNSKRPFYFEDGLVRISKDQFTRVLELAGSTSLKMSTFKPIENGRIASASFHGIASALGMSEEESKDLRALLGNAATARIAWEKENVIAVRRGAGTWEIRVPGDGGAAIQELRDAFVGRFGEERAAQIDLLGDLDGFFRGPNFLSEFLHGVIEVRAVPVAQGKLALDVKFADKTTRLEVDGGYMNHEEFIERYALHLGGLDAIRAEAMALGK